MIFAGFDPAGRTGWAVGDCAGNEPLAGFWDLPELNDRARPRALASLYSAAIAVIRHHKVTLAAIEHPLHIGSAHGDEGLTMLSGAIQAAAVNGGAQIVMVYPATWRKVFLGVAYPEEPKDECLARCRLHRWAIEDHNAGDAAGIWFWARRKYGGRSAQIGEHLMGAVL